MALHRLSIIFLISAACAYAQVDYSYRLRKPEQDPLFSSDLVHWVVPEYGPTVDGASAFPMGYMVKGLNSSIVLYDIDTPSWVNINNPYADSIDSPVVFELLGDVKTTLVTSSNSTSTTGLPSDFHQIPLSELQIGLVDPYVELYWIVNITDGTGASTVKNMTAPKDLNEYTHFNLPLPYVAPLTVEVAGSSNQTISLVFQEEPPMRVAYFPNGGDTPEFTHHMNISITYIYGEPRTP